MKYPYNHPEIRPRVLLPCHCLLDDNLQETAELLSKMGLEDIQIFPSFVVAKIPCGWQWDNIGQYLVDCQGDLPWHTQIYHGEQVISPHPKYARLIN